MSFNSRIDWAASSRNGRGCVHPFLRPCRIGPQVGRCFGILYVAQPFHRIVVEAFATFVSHVLGQAVDHQPQRDVHHALHEHGIASLSLRSESLPHVVPVSGIAAYLLHRSAFRRKAVGLSGAYLLELEAVAYAL